MNQSLSHIGGKSIKVIFTRETIGLSLLVVLKSQVRNLFIFKLTIIIHIFYSDTFIVCENLLGSDEDLAAQGECPELVDETLHSWFQYGKSRSDFFGKIRQN